MSPDGLRANLRVEPFRPFRLHLSDGTFHTVTGPEWLVVGVRTSVLFRPSAERPDLPDEMIFLDNLHVAKTTPLALAPTDG
jgi:hypothetical protein